MLLGTKASPRFLSTAPIPLIDQEIARMSKKHPFSRPERKDGGETNFKRDGFEDEDEDEDESESPTANAKEAAIVGLTYNLREMGKVKSSDCL
jgi:hypothetical protein